MPRKSETPKNVCKNSYFMKASKDCASGFVCKLDKDNVVYPNRCNSTEYKRCWRLKCGTS